MINLKERQPDEYGLSTTELGHKIMLDFEAAFNGLNKDEKERDKRLTERRRAAEDARVERELMKDFDEC